jgi:tetratricopeptide (TPR) repeat protein
VQDLRQGSADELLLRAECLLRADQLTQAAAVLEQVRRQAPEAAYLARLRLAELRYFQGDPAGAGQQLDSLLQQDPRHELANDALSLLLLLEEYPSQAEALSALARAQLRERQGRAPEAATEWEYLAAHAPPVIQELSLLCRAQAADQGGQPRAALAWYQQALTKYPQGRYHLEAWLGSARLLAQLGDAAAALKTYESALMQFPDEASAPHTRLEIQRLRRLVPGQEGG